jgi:hypothetical protein
MASMSRARKRRVVAVGVVALAAAAVAGVVVVRSFDGPDDIGSGLAATPTTASPVIDPDGSIVASTSTPRSVATDPTSTVTAPPPSREQTRPVEVVLAYADWDDDTGVSAAGYVAQTVEQGGTCTLTLTLGQSEVTVSGPGAPDASSVACGGLAVPPGKLSSGTWTSVLSYSSSTSAGSSDAVPVEVP